MALARSVHMSADRYSCLSSSLYKCRKNDSGLFKKALVKETRSSSSYATSLTG